MTEIARHPECETEAVVEALDALVARRAGSLDAPRDVGVEEGTVTRHDVVGSDDEHYELVELRMSIKAAIVRPTTTSTFLP